MGPWRPGGFAKGRANSGEAGVLGGEPRRLQTGSGGVVRGEVERERSEAGIDPKQTLQMPLMTSTRFYTTSGLA